MVKGVARRVIMVDSPDPKLFEQALFLVREEAFGGTSPEQVLKQAEASAKRYLLEHHSHCRPSPFSFRSVMTFLGGALVSSGAWALLLHFSLV